VAVGRVQLQLVLADLDVPRHRQRLHPWQRQRPGPLDVVLLVELPQLALRDTRLGRQPRRARLRRAQRRLRERVDAE
jgi:hypothetical protein